MAQQREPFPSTSIGRSARIARQPSHDTLSTHPLLSPNSSAASPAFTSLDAQAANSHSTPKYAAYTPARQRSGTPGVDLPTSITPSNSYTATGKLQLMNLKAAAQNVALDTRSLGWAMLEKIIYESDHSPEWTEIWTSITTGKASLLLPLEHASANERITPDLIKDHVIFCNGPSRHNAPIITLSGLRGTLSGETLTLRSSIFPASKAFHELLGNFSRPTAMENLPPLPETRNSKSYPRFQVPGYVPSLPLPPRLAGPPALPPRPNNRTPSGQTRLSSTFTSLFGKTASQIAASSSPSSSPLSTSPLSSATSTTIDLPDHSIALSAFTIDRRIIHQDICRDINKALRAELQESLSNCPPWVVERVHDFTSDYYPFVKPSSPTQVIVSGLLDTVYAVNPHQDPPDDTSDRSQEFYFTLEEAFRSGGSGYMPRKKEREGSSGSVESEEVEKMESEGKIREVIESVESAICTLFYDRLYLQSTSDDASHDEALSSRVAALNMLDLKLEHLDVQVGDAGPALDSVIRTCGKTLAHLDRTSRSPASKVAIMVAAHKNLVESLSNLPPIRLYTEEESEARRKLATQTLPSREEKPLPHLSPAPSSVDNLSVASTTASEEDEKPGSNSEPQSPQTPIAPPRKESTPVSGDILLPLIIFAVVKSNPPHFVSNLLYTQRFRNQSLGGEESYCLINLLAVAEFLENVDLGALGLADSESKILSAASLTPIQISRSPDASPLSPGIRGRVENSVDAIAGSASRVVSGVVDTSFGMLRLLLPHGNNPNDLSTPPVDNVQNAAPWNGSRTRAGFGLLRRESGFSIASIAASLPGGGTRSKPALEETGRPLLAVTKPSGLRSAKSQYQDYEYEGSDGGQGSEDVGDEDDEKQVGVMSETRSLRSFESMMKSKENKDGPAARKSLSDRLAHMSGLARLQATSAEAGYKASPTPPRRNAVLPSLPNGSEAPPTLVRIPPPVARFLDYSADDIKVSEVGELLREYQRVVQGMRALGGFDE